MSRVAVVTGGTRGIGAALCKDFKKAGYNIIANFAHNDEAAKKFRDETGIPTSKWDVSHPEECIEAINKIEKEFGPVDVLVNNAGITRDAMLHKMDPKDWLEVINTNLNSAFFMSRAVITGMRERGFGRIINISSINAQAGQLGQTNYCAAKSGLLGFTKALARESASKGITVNAVAPGYTKTEMIAHVPEKILEKIVSQIPIGHLGVPDDISRCVLFLAADDAGFITGETISVNGGHHME